MNGNNFDEFISIPRILPPQIRVSLGPRFAPRLLPSPPTANQRTQSRTAIRRSERRSHARLTAGQRRRLRRVRGLRFAAFPSPDSVFSGTASFAVERWKIVPTNERRRQNDKEREQTTGRESAQMEGKHVKALVDCLLHRYIQGPAKRSADFVKQQPVRARQKS